MYSYVCTLVHYSMYTICDVKTSCNDSTTFPLLGTQNKIIITGHHGRTPGSEEGKTVTDTPRCPAHRGVKLGGAQDTGE